MRTGPTSSVMVVHGTWIDGTGLRVGIDDGRIVTVEDAHPGPDGVVVPGFVDLQVNGVDDVDCATASGADWDRIGARLAATGTTAWLPTLVSQPLSRVDARLAEVRAAIASQGEPDALPAARILGVHLEGPFLGGRPGAHRVEHIIGIDLDWLDGLGPEVRLVTLAPEQPLAAAAIGRLTGRGVVASLGHSGADRATAAAGFDSGARFATHLFNAMAPLHHREPGLVGAALADDRVTVGLIADGVHVHASLLPVVVAAKGAHRVAVVTDAVAAETEAFGMAGVRVVDGAPRLPDGTIAGSVLTTDGALRNLIDAGVDPSDAVATLTATPAAVVGDHDRGGLAPGARGDLVVLDPDALTVRRTVIGGRVAFEA